jgi:hypothetical protein
MRTTWSILYPRLLLLVPMIAIAGCSTWDIPAITNPVFPGSEQEAFERTNRDTRMPSCADPAHPVELVEALGGPEFLRVQIWLRDNSSVLVSLPEFQDAQGNPIPYRADKVRCYLFNDVYGLTALFSQANQTIEAIEFLEKMFSAAERAWTFLDAHGDLISSALGMGVVQSATIEASDVQLLQDVALSSVGQLRPLGEAVGAINAPGNAAHCVTAVGMGLADIQLAAQQRLMGSQKCLVMGKGDVLTLDFSQGAFLAGGLPSGARATIKCAWLDYQKLAAVPCKPRWQPQKPVLPFRTWIEGDASFFNLNYRWLGLHTDRSKMLFLLKTSLDVWETRPALNGVQFSKELSLSAQTGQVVQQTLDLSGGSR